MIVFSPPPLGWPPLAALALFSAAALGLAALRRARGTAWRGAGLLLLMGVLSGPAWVVQTRRPLPDILIVALDGSQSMALGSRTALADRARSALQAEAGKIDNLQFRVVTVPPAADGTPLFSVLRGAMADIPEAQRAGVVVITDGEVTDAPAANPFGAPLAALLTAKGEEKDRELRLLSAPGYGLVGQDVPVSFTVIDHGASDAGALVPVTVAVDGAPVWSQPVPLARPISVPLPVRRAGPAVISVSAGPLAGEVSAINNEAAFTLNGVRRRLRVLLVSGDPNQEERTWRILLKSDPAVQLVHFTILRTPGELIDALPEELALVPFPVDQLFGNDIGKFDLIIFDRFDATGLLPQQYLANIASRVRQGGALLAEVGPEFASNDSLAFTPLGPLLPAVPAPPGTVIQAFSPTVSPLGAHHPVTEPFVGQPLAPWYRQEMARAVAGDVLMTGASGAPLLLLSRVGQGRVALLLSDQFWLWTKDAPHSGPALPLLRRCVHWLLDEPALQEEALTASIASRRLSITRRSVKPTDPGDATVTAPDGTVTRLPLQPQGPGVFAASMPASQTGVWRVQEGGLVAAAAAMPQNMLEYQDLAATAGRLAPVADRVIWLGRTPEPALAPLLRQRVASQVTGTRNVPLLPPLPTMILALALLGVAWWREGSAGPGAR